MESSALIYIILTVVTVGLALFIDNREYVSSYISGRRAVGLDRRQARNLTAQIGIYGLLAGVSACRIAVGNDYWPYVLNFEIIGQGRFGDVSSEFGFNYLVYWMQDLLGYRNYLPIFGLFSLVTVFFFVKALNDQGEWYAASLYLLLTGGYYFNSMNSVRYYFVLAIALFSMKYVIRGEYGKFILWILGASCFHKSVLLVIPVYLLARWLSSIKLKRWHFILGGALLTSLIFGQDLYRRVIFYFYPFYEGSAFDNGELSLTNIAKCVGVLALCVVCYRESIRDSLVNRFYFFLNLGGLVLYTCGSFIPEVSRVGYYLIISQVFLIPNLLAGMKKGWLQRVFIVGTAAAFAAYFGLFLYRAYDTSIRLLPYLNWIFD